MSCCRRPKCKQIGKVNKTVRYAEGPNRNLAAFFDESNPDDTLNLTDITNANSERSSNNNTNDTRTFQSLLTPINRTPPSGSNGNRNRTNPDMNNSSPGRSSNGPRTSYSLQRPMNTNPPSGSNGNGNRTYTVCNNSNQNVNQTYTIEDNANGNQNTPQNLTYNIESYDNNRTFVICPSNQNTEPEIVNETYVIDAGDNRNGNNPNATYTVEAPPPVNDETYVVAPAIDNETYIICPSTNSTRNISEPQNDTVDSETLPCPADLRGQRTLSSTGPRPQGSRYQSSAGGPRRVGSRGGGLGTPGGSPIGPVRPRSPEGPRTPQGGAGRNENRGNATYTVNDAGPNENRGNATYTVNDAGAPNPECAPCNRNFWRTLQRFIDMSQEIINYAKDKINQQIEDCGKQLGNCDKCQPCIESQRTGGANVPVANSPETMSEPRSTPPSQRRRCPLSNSTFRSAGGQPTVSSFRDQTLPQAQSTPVVPGGPGPRFSRS